MNLLRNPVFILSFCAGILVAAPIAGAQGPALAAGSTVQTLTYEVYAGGINAVRAELHIDLADKERYNLALAAQTKGFLGKLAPWSGTFMTEGWRIDGEERPALHKSSAIWREEEDFKEYYYTPDGGFEKLVVMEPGQAGPAEEAVAAELVQGTTDALTATLQVMERVSETGICEGRNEVFDGKRRFALVFRHKADEMLQASDYNVYEGRSARCEVEVVPVAGDWHKKPRGWMSIQEQGRKKGTMPTVWMGQLSADGPAVPVKIRVRTDYGTLFMHLVDYRNGDTVLQAEEGAVEEQ